MIKSLRERDISAVTVKPWYRMSTDEVFRVLGTSQKGLSVTEAERRLGLHGPNMLKEEDRRSPWPILLRQFANVMSLILLVAATIAWVMGDITDMVMILIIVVLNVLLGFSQEYRAERALAALQRLEQPQVVVRRSGEPMQISSQRVVPGDLMALEAGQRIMADARIVEAVHLKVNESHITGESVVVTKHIKSLPKPDLPLGDRSNMIFMGTTVMTGHGWAVVTETGMKTELGKIAHLLQTVEEHKTPLQVRLAYLGKWLAAAALIMTAVIFIAGLMRGEPLEMMLLTAISLAVAVIPEGLPVMVTIVLALGAQRLVGRNALIRKLPAVETLGCVTTICSDKTGTLTQNVMSLELIYFENRLVYLTGDGYLPKGSFYENGKELDLKTEKTLPRLLWGAALCTNAQLRQQDGIWTVLGDPTEGALLVGAAKAGFWKDELEKEYPKIGEVPFDSVRKLMTTVHKDREGQFWAFTKGGIEEILSRTSAVTEQGMAKPIEKHHRNEIMKINQQLGRDGVRVLACAMRRLESAPSTEDLKSAEKDLVFLGLLGMMDPPRPEVKAAVAKCWEAGIRPIMITGDHRVTAEAIASNLGIKAQGDRILTGEELESLTEEELVPLVKTVSVYARVSPEHKVKIVRALKHQAEIVAMTGDGVNDAPALRAADIGVAMGRGGTDVAREASQMILLDNNFATIVSAVEEGRMIYDNIRKFTRYMLSHNAGEILTMFFAILFALPLPLLPVQILWMNLVTDGLPALALSVEPPDRAVMKRPPRYPKESLFAGGLGFQIVWIGLFIGLLTTVLFAWAYHKDNNLLQGQTMAFFTLTIFQMFNVLAMRSERDALWTIGFLSNPKLMGAVLLTFIFQLAITYLPFLQTVFHTTALTVWELFTCIAVASTVYFAVEGEKWWRYRRGVQ